jgi:hypothetical protein
MNKHSEKTMENLKKLFDEEMLNVCTYASILVETILIDMKQKLDKKVIDKKDYSKLKKQAAKLIKILNEIRNRKKKLLKLLDNFETTLTYIIKKGEA